MSIFKFVVELNEKFKFCVWLGCEDLYIVKKNMVVMKKKGGSK